MGVKIMEKLHDMNIKANSVTTVGVFNIFPSKDIATSVVEPYNTVLYIDKCLELANKNFIDWHVCFDNQALYKVCQNVNQLDIKAPTYDDLNVLIAQAFSTLTLSQRFDCVQPKDLLDIKGNLCLYNRMKFLMTAYGPLYNE